MKVKLFWLVLAWIIGMGLGVLGQGLGLSLVIAAGGAMILWRLKSGWPVLAAVFLISAAGWWRGEARKLEAVNTYCEIASGEEATIVDRPEKLRDRTRFVMERDSCRWQVAADRHTEISRDDTVVLTGGDKQRLEEIKDYSAGYAEYLERQGISGTWQRAQIRVVSEESNGWLTAWRGRLLETINRLWGEPEASVIGAMLLAEKGSLPDELKERFRATGVSHVLAISGLHISLLTGVFVGLLYLLPLSPWTRTVAAAGLLWLYVVSIGLPASAMRAASFWSLTLMAFRLHRLASLPTVITLTAAILITVNPRILFEIGFQLSISAVIGIFLTLFLAKRVYLPMEKGGAGEWLWRLLLVSIGAALATGPLAAYHFGTVSLIGIAANVMIVPLVPLVLVPAMAALLLAFISLPAALLVAYVPHLVLAWFEWVTGVLSGVPGVYWQNVELPLWGVGVFYAGAAVLVFLIVKWQKRSWREVWG